MALRGVCTRARLRRVPFNNGRAQSWYLCIHISNHVAKLRSVATDVLLAIREFVVQEEIDFIAGDFNGTAWDTKGNIPSALYSTTHPCRVQPKAPPLWGPGSTSGKFTDYCGFLKAPGTEKEWLIKTFLQNLIGVRDMSSEALGQKPNDQAHSRYLGFLHFNADRNRHAGAWGSRGAVGRTR